MLACRLSQSSVPNGQQLCNSPSNRHRLGVGYLLRRSLTNTNSIESCLSTVERVARNVKRWHGGDQALCRTATGLLDSERKFRKVKGFCELPALQHKLNPSLTQQAQLV